MTRIVVGHSGRRAVEVDPSLVKSVEAVPGTNRVAITFTNQASQLEPVHIDAVFTKGPKATAQYVRSIIDHAARRPKVH